MRYSAVNFVRLVLMPISKYDNVVARPVAKMKIPYPSTPYAAMNVGSVTSEMMFPPAEEAMLENELRATRVAVFMRSGFHAKRSLRSPYKCSRE